MCTSWSVDIDVWNAYCVSPVHFHHFWDQFAYSDSEEDVFSIFSGLHFQCTPFFLKKSWSLFWISQYTTAIPWKTLARYPNGNYCLCTFSMHQLQLPVHFLSLNIVWGRLFVHNLLLRFRVGSILSSLNDHPGMEFTVESRANDICD